MGSWVCLVACTAVWLREDWIRLTGIMVLLADHGRVMAVAMPVVDAVVLICHDHAWSCLLEACFEGD